MSSFAPLRSFLGLLLFIPFLLTGCATTLHLSHAEDSISVVPLFRKGFIVNPELKDEYLVLVKSHKCELVLESDAEAKIELLPIRRYGRCGNPLILSIISFGLIPGYIDAGLEYQMVVTTAGHRVTYFYRLNLVERYSVWEHLVPNDRVEVMAKALSVANPWRVEPNKIVEVIPTAVMLAAPQPARQP